LGVAEDLHGDTGVDVEVGEEGAAAASAVVHGDLADIGLGAAGVPGAVEVAGFDRRAVAGGEDQVAALPGSAGLSGSRTRLSALICGFRLRVRIR
jgi:hypothetical protein